MKNSLYNTKGAFELKDLNADKKEVAFYLSKFDVLDSDFDIIKKGAFTKSIKERGPGSTGNRKIAFLRFHDWEKPIGTFKTLEEDNEGLFAVASLGNSTLALDAWNDYNDGIIREHSIGYQYIKDKMRFVEDPSLAPQGANGYYEINEVKLYEGSAVTFGANEYTEVVGLSKGENKPELIEKITGEIDLLLKALTNGKGSDERLYDFEMKIKYLNSRLALLATSEPFVKHSETIEPTKQNEGLFEWNKVLTNIKF